MKLSKLTTRPAFHSLVVEAGREARADLSAHWARSFLGVLFALWVIGLLILQLEIIFLGFRSSSSACRPDGTFSPFKDYSYWDIQGFFQVNLAFGKLTFTQAKAIDTIWDVIVGRCGQAILGFFSWRSFADYATVSMESVPITYTTFITLFLERSPLFISTLRLTWTFILIRGLKSKFVTVLMIINMLFVLAWPTLISLMSGYTPKTEAYVQDFNDNLIPYASLQSLAYIIHDGWRINLDGDYPVPSGSAPDGFGQLDYCPVDLDTAIDGLPDLDEACYLLRNTSSYTSHYGFNGTTSGASRWMFKDIPGPALNIEPFLLSSERLKLFGGDLTKSRNFWTYGNRTYSLEEIQTSGSCQPAREAFQWGFSYIQLFIVIVFLIIWTPGTYAMWLKAHVCLPLKHQPERPRGMRALLLLAEKVSKQLAESGINPNTMKNRELKREIKDQLKQGSVSFGFSLRTGFTRRDFKSWVRRDLGWCIVAGLFCAGIVITYYTYFLLFIVFTLEAAGKSRVFLSIFSTPLLLAVDFGIISIILYNSFG
ncbi:hypothetical protein F5Y19DRAFT_222498 [Xylariaceae sp. FL1651]|nr:hypothetical protein F5Y19DRAFT_222498 [Xylariaceae sp. FL1651]